MLPSINRTATSHTERDVKHQFINWERLQVRPFQRVWDEMPDTRKQSKERCHIEKLALSRYFNWAFCLFIYMTMAFLEPEDMFQGAVTLFIQCYLQNKREFVTRGHY